MARIGLSSASAHRIELTPRFRASLARRLEESADVAAASVVPAQNEGPPRLVAFVVRAPGSVATGSDLRRDASMRLPTYMVPTRILVVDALPESDDEAALHALGSTDPLPDGPIETAIAERWGRELAAHVSRDDDFFELGGTFPLANRTMAIIEEHTGTWLPASTLLHHRTPAALARAADSAGRPATSIVELSPGPAGRVPLLLTYDMDGSAFTMADLAHAIGGRTILGIDLPTAAGIAGTGTGLADLAAIHVADLVARYPEGPYAVAGYSLGAVLAFEIARQLEAAGRRVDFLGLIDLGPVHVSLDMGRKGIRPAEYWPWRPPRTHAPMTRARAYAAHAGGLPRGRRLEYLIRAAGFGRDWDVGRAEIDLRRTGRVRPALRRAWAWFRLMEAAVAYRPSRYRGDVVLFVSEQTAKGNIPTNPKVDFSSKLEPTLGWGPHIDGDLEIWPVIGCHTDLIEPPYVEELGRHVRRALDAAVPAASEH